MLAVWLVFGVAAPAPGVEPVTVSVEGIVPIDEESRADARERALLDALTGAAVETALRLLDDEGTDEEALRELLGPRAEAFVLTYRIGPGSGPRISPEDPEQEEYRLELVATIDAARVRAALEEAALLGGERSKPSLLLLVREADTAQGDEPGPTADPFLVPLEHYLKERLQEQGFAIVEPALHVPGRAPPRDALGRARALGADVGIDVYVAWRERGIESRIVGGVSEVRVRAQRAADGAILASARFDAPAYHTDPAEARTRSLEALHPQVAENLILQLERNWEALAGRAVRLELVLVQVSTLAQVEAVLDALLTRLGSTEARLEALGPHRAQLALRGRLSPGLLQERLLALPFEGFHLEPVTIEPDRLELRVMPAALEPPAPPLAAP